MLRSIGTASYSSEVGDYLGRVTTTQVNSALHFFGVANSSTSLGRLHYDPVLCVISRNGDVEFTNRLYPSLPLYISTWPTSSLIQ